MDGYFVRDLLMITFFASKLLAPPYRAKTDAHAGAAVGAVGLSVLLA